MLSNGTWDMETRQILLSMFVRLVQSLSVNILRLVIPMQEVRVRSMTDEESTRAFHTISTVLQQSIGEIFARALNVPITGVDTDDSKELTDMIESEVTQKVNSALSAASQEEQMGSVNSPLSADTGLRMVDKAKACLRACLSALRCSCVSSRSCTNSTTEIVDPATPRVASESAIYNTKKGPCYCCFSIFARKSFSKMQENLDDKIPSTTQLESTTPIKSITPEVLRTSATHVSTGVSGRRASPLKSPEIDYEIIRQDVDKLFRELNLAKRPGLAVSQRRLCEVLRGDEMNRFSQRLTDIMYCHFNLMDASAQAVSPNTNRQRTPKTHNLQLVYTIVEAEVTSYLTKLAHFLQQDIFDMDLFERSMENPPVVTPVYKLWHEPTPSHISRACQVSSSSLRSKTSETSQVSEQSFNGRRHDLFERSMVHPKACVPSFISRDVPAIVLRTPPETELSQSQSMMQCLIASLMIKMFKGKVMLHPKDRTFQVIYNRLTKKAWQEIYIPDKQLKPTEKNLKQIIDGVLHDLQEEYGTAHQMLRSALDETNGTFDDKVVKLLQIHLCLIKPPLLTRIGRFFRKCFCMRCESD
ncbi:hypothetical protein WMY93_029785 [Mugilogobius chulae]|uniref:Uncharacterized protein n=1 Tax=Mugilogobius chulae TaxID=88201 RepID=A0AAW0MXN1_9GOBI